MRISGVRGSAPRERLKVALNDVGVVGSLLVSGASSGGAHHGADGHRDRVGRLQREQNRRPLHGMLSR